VLRSHAFLLDPIIARVLLGQGQRIGVYPVMPRKEKFEEKGYRLDPDAVVKEVHDILYRTGRVVISKRDASQEGSTLSFSQGLRDDLWAALSDGTQSMIRDYIRLRAAAEGFTGSTAAASAVPSNETLRLIVENEELRREIAHEKRRRINAEGREARLEYISHKQAEEAKQHVVDLDEVKNLLNTSERRLHASNRKYHRMKRKARMQIDLGLRGKRIVEVRNVCTDPDRPRTAGEKRKRDPSVAFECAWVMIRGTKEPRPFGGGLRWTVAARYQEFANFVRTGVDSARRTAWLREAALQGRALRVLLVPIGRKGCLRRNVLFTAKQKRARALRAAEAAAMDSTRDKASNSTQFEHVLLQREALDDTSPLEGVKIFDNPSRRTVNRDIIPTCMLLFSLFVSDILNHPSTVKVGINCDFAKAKGFSCMGAVISVFQRRVVFTDPFGGEHIEIICRTFKLPMTQSNNKVTRLLKDIDGKVFTREAASCLVKAMVAGNVAKHLLEHPEMYVWACDGATENCGLGGDSARQNFCGTGGLISEILVTKTAWDVLEGGRKSGLLDPLDEFFGHRGFPWPGTKATEHADADRSGNAASSVATDASATDGSDARAARTSLEVPLDATGAVYKDPRIVERLRGLWVSETQSAKQKDRDETLRVLEAGANAGPEANRVIRAHGPCRPNNMQDQQRRDRFLEQLHKHETEFQNRMWKKRVLSLDLYRKRIAELDALERLPRSSDPPVSMEHNPCLFLPLICTSDGKSVGEGRHCLNHRFQNLINPMTKSLNNGILEQCVSTTTHLRSEYNWGDFRSAINFFLVPTLHAEISEKTDFYSRVVALVEETMALEDLIKQCEFDLKKGITPPKTAGIARWGTAFDAAQYLAEKYPLIAFAIVKRGGSGLMETKVRAAAAVVTPNGFDSSKFQNLRIDHHLVRHFSLVTTTSDLVQLAILSFVNKIVQKPLMAAISSDHECGLQAMGLESKLRCVLIVLTRDIFVRAAPNRAWGRGWNKWTPLAFRTHGAEFNPEPSLRLLDPNCEAKVRRRFGDFPGFEKLVDAASGAIPEFVRTLKMLARRPGQMLPDDSLKLWEQENPKLAAMSADPPGPGADLKHKQLYDGRESFAARVSQGQWLAGKVANDCVTALTREKGGMHLELFGISGWVANMGKTIMSRVYKILKPDGTTVESRVVIPGDVACANAANAYVQARDILATFEMKGVDREEVVNRLPAYCAFFRELDTLEQYFSQREGRYLEGGPGVLAEKNTVVSEGGHGAVRENVPVDLAGGQDALNEILSVDADVTKSLMKPVSCFPVLEKCSTEARSCICNSKKVESSFSPMKVVGRAKGQALFSFMSMLYRKHNYNTALLDAESLICGNEKQYWKAQDLAKHPGWDWVNTKDSILGDLMGEADIQDKLQDKNKTVARGGNFKYPGHGVTSRTGKYSGAGSGCGAGRGRRAGLGREAGGRGRAASGRGGVRGRGGKRVREEVVELPLDPADYEHPDVSNSGPRLLAKRVRTHVLAAKPKELSGDIVAPQRSVHAKHCLSRQRSSDAKDRAKKRFARLQKERAERLKLANEDASQSDLEPPASAASSASDSGDQSADDADWEGTDRRAPTKRARNSTKIASKNRKRARTCPRNDDDCGDLDDGGCEASEASGPGSGLESAEPSQPNARRANVRSPRANGGRGGRGRSGSRLKAGRRGGSRGCGPRIKVSRGGSEGHELTESSEQDNDSDSESHAADSGWGDLDAPLGPGIRSAATAAAVFVSAPTVGAKVDIKWDPTKWAMDKGGWCSGVVKAISDGKILAPRMHGRKRGRREIVEAGYSIVEYGRGEEYVHPLDQAHHVSNWGDRVDAWRLLSIPDDAGSGGEDDQLGGGCPNKVSLQAGADQLSAAGAEGGGGAGGGCCLARARGDQRGERARHGSNQGSDADDDDVPLFPIGSGSSGTAGKDRAGAAVLADGAAVNVVNAAAVAATAAAPECQPLASNGEASRQRDLRGAALTKPPKNVWSLSYCAHVFGKLQPEQFRLGVAKYSAGMYVVTRKMPTTGEFSSEANIRIPVRTETSKMYYLAYTMETGLTLFAVTVIRKPNGNDWSKTLTGYQVFTTEEALNRVDRENDDESRGRARSLGARSLRHQASLDRNRRETTYHACDWEVHMDVRCIVGVVRQALDKHRKEYDKKTHTASGCPAKASLIFTADPFSEERGQRLDQTRDDGA